MGSSSSKLKYSNSTPNKPYIQEYKMVFIGDGAVGKTCLLITYTEGKYPREYVPTVFDNYEASIDYNDENLKFSLWDTAGEEGYSRIRTLSYPNTDLFCICYSVVNHCSYNNVKERWYAELQQHKSKDSRIMIVGLKTDLRNDKQIIEDLSKEGKEPLTFEHGQNIAQEIGAIGYVECSSLTQDNIRQVFEEAFKFFIDKKLKYNDPSYDINDYVISLPISRAKSARK